MAIPALAKDYNAKRIDQVLRQFGFAAPELTPDIFMTAHNVIRIGVPPMRLEILATVSGVEFGECVAERVLVPIGDLVVPVISLRRRLSWLSKRYGR
jgi:hypothetical protein